MTSTIQSIDMHEVFISSKTIWAVVEVVASSGARGLGEVTLFGREAGVRQQLEILRGVAVSRTIKDREALLRPRFRKERDCVAQVALAGIDQALIDIRARELNVSATELIGGCVTPSVPVYANINRGTSDRSPEGYAMRAREAVAAGYSAIKVAPFDGVRGLTGAPVSEGIEKVLAIRDAVGPNVAINVDCHARFTEVGAKEMIAALTQANPFWIEQPIDEAPYHRRALRRVRSFANDRGIRIAGAESDYGLDAYRCIVNEECMDVLLPDIRLSGGVTEVLRIAHLVDSAGLEFSLHNPVGPVLDAISLQVARVAPSLVMLERTFRESKIQNLLTSPNFREPVVADFDKFGDEGWGISLCQEQISNSTPDEASRHVDFHAVAGAGQYA